MIQTHADDKKPHFRPDVGLLDPNSGCNFFSSVFSKIWLRQSLDIMARYHQVKYQGKLMI